MPIRINEELPPAICLDAFSRSAQLLSQRHGVIIGQGRHSTVRASGFQAAMQERNCTACRDWFQI
jgi:hypothetical protein